jgi:hypothetical protein
MRGLVSKFSSVITEGEAFDHLNLKFDSVLLCDH